MEMLTGHRDVLTSYILFLDAQSDSYPAAVLNESISCMYRLLSQCYRHQFGLFASENNSTRHISSQVVLF